jgi:bacterioferritin-associated ferredoxin
VYICLCRVVTRTEIEGAIAAGARTVQEVGQRCGAGTDCGKCQRTISRLLETAGGPPPEAKRVGLAALLSRLHTRTEGA